MLMIRRPMGRAYPRWHNHAHATPWAPLLRGGAHAFTGPGAGPFGPVGPLPGGDAPYVGMDPSSPATYVRPYRPAPGMIAWLNFDGAAPNPGQVIS